MRTIRDELTEQLLSIQKDWGISEPHHPEVTIPTNIEYGEYSSNLALSLWSKRSLWPSELQSRFIQPRQLAQALIDELRERWQTKQVRDLSVAGPGFINVSVADNYFYSLISFLTKNDTLIKNTLVEGGIAVVEYSSPNIAKPFTIGHLRSTIIGQAVANILTAVGYDVRRDNHLGDWGTQFGKQIYSLLHLGKGSLDANLAELEKAEQPVKYLVDLYIEFHAKAEADPSMEDEARSWFKRLEDGDTEARRLWQLCIDYSWQEFSHIYERLGVEFTENEGRGYGESYFEDKMDVVVSELERAHQAGLLRYETGKEDAKLVFFPDDELPPLMILKKDGATLYATRDLATDYWRRTTYGSDVLIVNEVGAEQALYFQQIYRIEELLGWYQPSQRIHVKHGLYRFAEGKMSTRKGNVIWLADVLDEAVRRATQVSEGRELPDEVAEAVGIGALKWNDLKRSSHLDVTFDWDEILSMQGNSGPYVQYTYVRALNILKKAADAPFMAEEFTLQSEMPALTEAERQLAQVISEYGEAVRKAAREYAPHHVATYLYSLAQNFNSFYVHHPVVSETVASETRAYRVQLVRGVEQILKNGLELLGIKAVERM